MPGKEVVLTLDADIQNRALEVFGEESGAAVVMDCRNGDILCMVSAPSVRRQPFVARRAGRELPARWPTTSASRCSTRRMTGTYPARLDLQD